MSSHKKLSALNKERLRVFELEQKLNLVEHHYDVMTSFARLVSKKNEEMQSDMKRMFEYLIEKSKENVPASFPKLSGQISTYELEKILSEYLTGELKF